MSLLINPYRFAAAGGGGGGTYSAEVMADSPAAYYRLGESSGTTLVDSSGNGRNGTFTGVTLGAAGAISGDSDTAWSLAGAGHGDVADAAWQRPASLTLEAWVKTTDTGLRSILDKDANSSRAWQFRMNGGKLEFIKIAGGIQALTSVTSINTGAWRHVAYTNDGTTGRLYIDGNLDVSVGMGTASAGTDPFTIGANRSAGYNSMWVGQMDEVAVYGAALSGTRIAAHYAAA